MGKHKRKLSDEVGDLISDHHPNKSSKKKKKKHTKDVETITEKSTEECHKVVFDANAENDNDVSEDSYLDKQKHKKRKKKKKSKYSEDDSLENEKCTSVELAEDSNAVLEGKSEQVDGDEPTNCMPDDVNSCKKKKKKHKKSSTHDNDNENELSSERVDTCFDTKSNTLGENVLENHSKKKKKKKTHESPALRDDSDMTVETKSVDKPEKYTSDTPERKTKKVKSNKTEENSLLNTNDCEKEICATNKAKLETPEKNCPKPFVGQWNTASLGDTERQNKFFKLLGGFKKGSDTKTMKNKFILGTNAGYRNSGYPCDVGNQTKNVKLTMKGNVAMDKQQEEEYTKTMEKEYDRALDMNFNRGTGLGFQKPPDEGKKFYIDTSKSKSIKFDDSD